MTTFDHFWPLEPLFTTLTTLTTITTLTTFDHFTYSEKWSKGREVGELEEDSGAAGVCNKRRGGRRGGRQVGQAKTKRANPNPNPNPNPNLISTVDPQLMRPDYVDRNEC